jgi:hypothetical protein
LQLRRGRAAVGPLTGLADDRRGGRTVSCRGRAGRSRPLPVRAATGREGCNSQRRKYECCDDAGPGRQGSTIVVRLSSRDKAMTTHQFAAVRFLDGYRVELIERA